MENTKKDIPVSEKLTAFTDRAGRCKIGTLEQALEENRKTPFADGVNSPEWANFQETIQFFQEAKKKTQKAETGFRFDCGVVFYNGKHIKLKTKSCGKTLELLYREIGKTVIYSVFETDLSAGTNTRYKHHISELKKAFIKHSIPYTIETIPTEGYMLIKA